MRICKLVFGLVITSALVWGQAASTAQLNGVVRDSSGLAVPGAEVKATQTATGAVRTATTESDGAYALPNLPIGPYMLEVTKEGFSKYVQTGIVLQVASNPTIDMALKVGAVTEQVTVEADAALVETHDSGVGTVVDNQRVVEMPLNGRNPQELVFLAGLATTAPVGSLAAGLSSVRNYPTVVISVGGGTGNGNSYLLDGVYYNDDYSNQNLPLPFPDALQEFKVQTSALPAQYGYHSAAAINAVTKSGTNEFHGDAFDFLRNGDLNSRDFFASARDTLKRNQLGGTIGGPVKKDRLFFFAGYQATVQKSSPPQNFAFVPTPEMLAGNFSAIASPACNSGHQINLPASLGFVNNQISPTALNSAALTIDSHLPVPTGPCGLVSYGLLSNETENLGVAKVDFQQSEKNSIFARTLISDLLLPSTFDGKNALTLNTAEAHYRVYTAVIGDTYVPGPGMVSSFRVAMNLEELVKPVDDFATWPELGVNATPLESTTVRISVTGNGFAIGSGSSVQNKAIQGPFANAVEDFSWVKGSHQIGFGGAYLHLVENFLSGLNPAGSMTFNGQVTGLALADFMLGDASAWNQGNFNRQYERQHYLGLYAQDSWKLNPRLTVNYGLRWEPYIAPTSQYGWYSHFSPTLFSQGVTSTVYVNAPPGMIFPGDPQYTVGDHPEGSNWNQWAPRFGLVWDPEGKGLMTIRAAYGIFTDRQVLQSFQSFTGDPPYGDNISLANVSLSNPWASYPGGNPFPLTLGKNAVVPLFGSYRTDPFNSQPTYVNQWNMSLQRQVGKDWLVTANYLGTSTIHLVTVQPENPAIFLGLGPCTINGVNYNPCSTTANTNQRRVLFLQNPAEGQYYARIDQLDPGGTAEYEGLLLSAQHRLSRGVSALANYTWSHCISDVFEFDIGTGAANSLPGNRRQYRSNCATGDQRQIFNLSMVAQTPQFSRRLLRILASGWQVAPILNLKSSQFFSVTTGVDGALSGQPVETPNLVSGVNPYVSNHACANSPCVQWITASAFSAPAPGTYGNLGLFNMKGPGIFQLDMALTRTFAIRERKTLQFRAEAFNLPNHVNLSIPTSTTNSGGAFGTITSDISGTQGLTAGDPRIIQMALKFVF
jgi:hypothetical protein